MQHKHIEGAIANGNGHSCACLDAPRGLIAQKPLKTAFAALLAFALSFMLMGCRDTDVLTQKVIDAPGVSEIDYSLDPVRTDAPESDEEDVANMYEGDSHDQDREKQEDEPEYQKDEPTTEQEADQQPFDRDAHPNGEATNGGAANGEEGDASDPSTQEGAHGGNATKQGDGDNTGAGSSGDPAEGELEKEPEEQDPEPQEPEAPQGRTIVIDNPEDTNDPQPEEDSPQPEQGQAGNNNDNTWNPTPSQGGAGTGDDNRQGQTYADGAYDTIPSVGKIAAAGPYATIVQSLGGKGALAAAPQQWLDSLPAAAYGGGAELVEVHGVPAWGDGRQMTDAAVQGIIESGAECVLTSNTYNVMNQEQANALNAAGVDVLVVPDIGKSYALDADIVLCVDVVGELLKDAGTSIQFDAKNAAATYKSMHNYTLETCRANNGGYTFAAWGNDNMYVDNYLYQGSSKGAARTDRRADASPNALKFTYMELWDPVQKVAVGTIAVNDDNRSAFNLIDYYCQHSGAQRGDEVIGNGLPWQGLEGHRLLSSFMPPRTYAFQIIPNGNGHSTPIAVARSVEVAEAFAGAVESGDYTVLLDNDRHRIDYNLGYDYNVFIVPQGADGCSWVDGTFESYLIAPWMYSLVRSNPTQPGSYTSSADSFVNDFYDTFYRCGAADCVVGYGAKVLVRCGE